MSAPSLYRTLQLSLSALFISSLLLAGYFTFHAAGQQIDRDYDGQLIADSYMVWTLVKEELGEEKNLDEVKELLEMHSLAEAQRQELAQFNQFRAFRVWKDNNLSLRSDTAQPDSIAEAPEGFSHQRIGTGLWRVYAMRLPDEHITVEVWENHKIRDRLLHKILRSVAAPAWFVIPLLWLALLGAIRFGLRSFHRMRRQIEARSPESLEKLHIKKLPRELKPLEAALNTLIEKLRRNLERERLLMDTTAHEIRTPLTTLKLQGQLITAAQDDAEREQAIAALLASLDNTVRLADQLLLFSKVSQQPLHYDDTLLYPLAQQVMADFALLAADKSIEMNLEGNPASHCRTHTEMLKILLGIFLDNAIKYTTTGGSISVEVSDEKITIEDSGPGICDADKPKVFDKFYRGSTRTKGTGLGLAIAREIGTRLSITPELSSSAQGGLKVTLRWESASA